MVNGDRLLVTLIRSFASAKGISVSYASKLLSGSGDTVKRIEAGMSLTARRSEKIIQQASNLWPTNTRWSSNIPRPEPSPGSPAAREAA